MIFKELFINGVYLISPEPIHDERGFFTRIVCAQEFGNLNLETVFPQCNISYNKKAYTFRGMHYQLFPHEEVKLVRCIAGAIYDVILDLRQSSPTYKKWEIVNINAWGRQAVYVPKGCAHGYLTLFDNTEVLYQVSEIYHKESERGVRFDDPTFNIALPYSPLIISSRDLSHGDYKE